ncbi:MAG: hypothetical protein L0J74_01595 [Corynebacterium sp.]|uniref:hypothetical protein n=1 Tax=Corynebacterium TaxID=1716 RepID=UPI0026499FDA|nr:hypothetical protein [Corynebacterium sp.]MDN6304491.1 hypothetical protein [Corynebacterium sp.]MDN6366310.1 hypothetical protein [Corynebacterium sp.]MDN6395084.1 hypothetical protein [Corynebacterium sp.]
MPEEEWIDAAAAAERYHCSTSKIRRWTKQGELEMRLETSIDTDGRLVFTTWLRVRDLDDVSGVTAHKEHVRKIRATARPFTDEQKVALRKVFLAHLLEREAKRKRARIGSAKAK